MSNSLWKFISSILGGFRTARDRSDGRRSNTGAARATGLVRSAWPRDLQLFFIEPSGKDVAEALDGWTWIGLDGLEPAAVSAFGDIFFRAADGSVHHLDMIEGRLSPISASWAEFAAQMEDAGRRDDLVLAGLVIAARKRRMILGAGECYDFKQPPVIGGEMSVGQMEKTFFVVKVHIAGQIHRQVKDLPPGTKINKVTISDR
ncbi:DUF1851 domain-containing protein [Mesorhizobium sp. CA13]|uniref:T6SS immunity protein Tdi1 domain-containing protein n=1 Tax=Mesorhizobium sp. CA13 TaxID=2876643 RepID=UPI001CC92E5E|nr:T6SS immunity protein Tdi1 domain-containing protein [Mesorhizobium sp. CA13]MBZ9852592.1 DUF1851 domain-containing protein [Mesorhizobium sp. CA13]